MATKKELVALAEELGVEEPNKMLKADLEQAIEDARAGAVRSAGVSTVAETLDGSDIVARKDGGESFADIAKDLDLSLAVVMTAYVQEVHGSIEATPKAVVAAREEGHGWRAIAAMAGISKSKAKELYKEGAGEDPSGRGRRTTRVGQDETESKPKAKSKKAKAPKAKAKKASKAKSKKAKASTGELDWNEASEDDIRSALEGKTVSAKGGDVEVEEVLRFGKTKAGKRVAQVQTTDGDKKNVVLETITAVA